MRQTLKSYALLCCLFVFLFVVLGGGLRLNPGGAFLGAATGTPLIVYGFSRLCRVRREEESSKTLVTSVPRRRTHGGIDNSVELSARAEPREGDGVKQIDR